LTEASVSSASTAIATSAVASATAASAARTLFAWPRFVDGECTPVDFRAVELRDCFVGLIACHLHKSKALGSTCVAIGYYVDGFDLAGLLEQICQI
jgi:hypothetical protein